MNTSCQILVGDALEKLQELPAESVQCCVTSPPYYGLRNYGDPRQLGAEATPGLYLGRLVAISREIRRILRHDGTFWLNLGDSYSSGGRGSYDSAIISKTSGLRNSSAGRKRFTPGWAKPKDRLMIPARTAIVLQEDGWYLRDEIVWHKPNPMVESVTDRTTNAHEFIYLLTKEKDYYYDADAIKEPISAAYANDKRPHGVLRQRFYPNSKYVKEGMIELNNGQFPTERRDTVRNKRSVWTVNTEPCSDAHFATYPPDLIKPCILAGTKAGDTVLDCFAGRGTTGIVALEMNRNAILIELNPEYAKMCEANTRETHRDLFYEQTES